MGDWFSQNAPKPQGGGDWFAKNAPAQETQAALPSGTTGSMAGDFFTGVGAGAVQVPLGVYDLIRKIPGVADHLPEPTPYIRSLAKTPDTMAGKAGRFLEGAAEFAVPAGMAAKATEGMGLAARAGAQALAGGATAAVDSSGNPASIAAGAVLSGAPSLIGGAGRAVAAPLLQKVMDASPRPLSAAAEAIAATYGVPLTRAMQGGSKTILAAEKMLGHTVAPDLYEPAIEAAQGGLKDGASDLAGKFAVDKFAAGDSAIQKLLAKSKSLQNQAHGEYSTLRNLEADPANIKTVTVGSKPNPSADPSMPDTVPVTADIPLPVDMRPAKTALGQIVDDVTRRMTPAQRELDPGLNAIKNIISRPDYLPASVAEKDLGYLKSILRGNASDGAKRIAGKAIDQLDSGITDAVSQAGPDATKALSNARSLWAKHEGVKSLVEEVSGDVTGKSGQVLAASRLLRPADASFPQLQKVLAETPNAAEDLGKAFLSTSVFKKAAQGGDFTNPTQASNLWNQIGPRTKAALYSPAQIQDVNSFLELAKRVSENPNPSNSGVLQAMLKMGVLVTHPVQGAAGLTFGRNIAKVLYSPGGAQTLKTALQSGGGQAGAAALAIKGLMNETAQQVTN